MLCENLPQCLTCKFCTVSRGDCLTYNKDNTHNFHLYLKCNNENVVEFRDDYGVSAREFIYDTELQVVWVDGSCSVTDCKHSEPECGYENLNVKSKRM